MEGTCYYLIVGNKAKELRMILGINDGQLDSLNYKNQPLVKNWVATVTPNPQGHEYIQLG